MALTGACPGTVLPQIATGVKSSLFVGVGGILGAMIFERYVRVTREQVRTSVWIFQATYTMRLRLGKSITGSHKENEVKDC